MKKSFFSFSLLLPIVFLACISFSCSNSDEDISSSFITDSDEIEHIIPPELPTEFTQKVVGEKLSGNWCGNCPRGIATVDELMK